MNAHFLWIFTIGLGGCCTTAICFDSLAVDFDPPLDAVGTYTLNIDGPTAFECSFSVQDDGLVDPEHRCQEPVLMGVDEHDMSHLMLSRTPKGRYHLTIERSGDGVVVDEQLRVSWDHDRPNGPMCGGDCFRGTAAVQIED